MQSFKTIFEISEHTEVIQKSKFIATCAPVETEEHAIIKLNSLRKKYNDATHNCYAYTLFENNIQRYSDDGEPQGTAGLPILNSIKAFDLHNILIVVTRYFGGTLLGTGGLCRAYSLCSKKSIESAKIAQMVDTCIFSLQIDYILIDLIKNYVMKNDYIKILNENYAEHISLEIAVKTSNQTQFKDYILDVSLGKASPKFNYSTFLLWS